MRSGLLLTLILAGFAAGSIGHAAVSIPDPALLDFAARGDSLGARLRVRELLASRPDARAWKWLQEQVDWHPEWGDDLGWFHLDKVADQAGWSEPSPLQKELEAADAALLSRRFADAVRMYQAIMVPARIPELGRTALQFVRLNLARALYGARKYDEARVEARRISPNFSRYRQVLFLQMWSAFRSGRVELALGDLAAQRSHYFGEYLEPESYLLLAYLLKRLCRDHEVAEVILRAEQFLADLKSGKFGFEDWARMEVGSSVYLSMTKSAEPDGLGKVQVDLRRREKASIRSRLEEGFGRKKKQWLEELPRVLAYSRLAASPGMASALKPIERITSRARLLSQGLEIWPADDGEQWLDELGSQRYLGDSQCAARR